MGRNANSNKHDGSGVQALAAAMSAQKLEDPQHSDVDAAQELDMLLAVPAGQQGRPYSCQKLIEARKLQKALFTYLGSERNVETETLEEQTLCLCRFLKSYVCILSAAEWTAHSMGDDVMIEAGFVAPFVTPGAQGPEFGVPSVIYEDTVCDNIDELTRATCAAIFACLIYQNVPQEDAESSPDQVASVFLSLALNSVRTPEQQAQFDQELQGIDLKVEGVSRLTCAELVALLLYFRADLTCMTSKVLHALGRGDDQKVAMVKALQDYANMIKLCPDVPVGYLKFAELGMSLNQIKHSGAILRRGLEACEKVGGAKLHSTRMRYMLAVCRVMGCGSGASDVSDEDDTAWTMDEIEELQATAKADLEDTMEWIPDHLRSGTTGTDNLQTRYQALLNDSLLETAKRNHGSVAPGTRLPPIKAMITTPLPKQLPQGALSMPSSAA